MQRNYSNSSSRIGTVCLRILFLAISAQFLFGTSNAKPGLAGKPKLLKFNKPKSGVQPLFSHDGKYLTSKTSKGIQVLDIKANKVIKTIKVEGWIKRFTWSLRSKGIIFFLGMFYPSSTYRVATAYLIHPRLYAENSFAPAHSQTVPTPPARYSAA